MSVNQIRPTLEEVAQERLRQVDQWGHQNHPDGTGTELDVRRAGDARRRCEYAFSKGLGTWKHILNEEVQEAFAESDVEKLRAELVQVAAVATAWVEAIDRRTT